MKLESKVHDALNAQIAMELHSSYFYLAMSAWCESQGYTGSAKWLSLQSEEEREHAMKIYRFILDRGASVALESIEKPAGSYKSLAALFQTVLAHEQRVSASILALYETAKKANDHATEIMLQWFITEQVEEEKNAAEVAELLKRMGDSPVSVMMADRQLGARAAS